MKLRIAKKVLKRVRAGAEYREGTLKRMRRRLCAVGISDDLDDWFFGMLDQFHREDPVGLAALQFDCGMKIAEAKWARA